MWASSFTDRGNYVWAWHADGTPVANFPLALEWDLIDEMEPQTLTLANLEGGPGLDVLLTVQDLGKGTSHLEAYRPDGTKVPGWPPADRMGVGAADARTAIGDINGDGLPEVVTAEDRATYLGTTDRVWAWRADGTLLPGFPVEMPTTPSGPPFGPVLADIDGDGVADIVVSSYFYVYALHGDGTVLSGWPQYGCNPVVADLNQDGHLEIVATAGAGVRVMDRWGTLEWQALTENSTYADPTVVDIDGDGQPEVVVRSYADLIYAWHADGSPVSSFPLPVGTTGTNMWPIDSGASIGDINGDGQADLVTGNSQNDSYLYAFPMPGAYNAYLVEWPMQGGSPCNDGRYVRHGAFGHGFMVTPTATPSTVPAGEATTLGAVVEDSMGHGAATWSWSDGGVGGTFSPSATASNPTYTVPSNYLGTELTLFLSATCDGPQPLTVHRSFVLTVQPKGALRWQGDDFFQISALAVNPTDGSCWVIDQPMAKVIHLSSQGEQLWRSPGYNTYAAPNSLSVNPTDGSCWVSDSYHGQLVHLSATGTELFRGGGLTRPSSVSVNPADGSCWAADSSGNCIVHVTAAGATIGSPIGGFSQPQSVAVDSSNGTCWVADTGHNQVAHLAADGSELWRGGGFSQPWAVSVNPTDGSCWVADYGNGRVLHLASTGAELSHSMGTASAQSVYVNPTDGSCWTTDGSYGMIVHLDANGLRFWQGCQFNSPGPVAMNVSDGSCWSAVLNGSTLLHLETEKLSASATPSAVGGGRNTQLSAIYTDSLAHGTTVYYWQDNGAGGTFSPSTAVANPTYKAPSNTTGTNQTVILRVDAYCCDEAPRNVSTAIVRLTVAPGVVAIAGSGSTIAAGGHATLHGSASGASLRTATPGHQLRGWMMRTLRSPRLHRWRRRPIL